MKILIVDDSDAICRQYRSILGDASLGESCDIHEAHDGQRGLSMAVKLKPSLILLDWHMPGLDGFGFLRAFRRRDKHTGVIMTTPKAEKHRVVEALRAGADDYLLKPISGDAVRIAVDHVLKRRAEAA